MSKQEIDSVLLANWYFVRCKFEKPMCPKTELAKKFLTSIIKKILIKN